LVTIRLLLLFPHLAPYHLRQTFVKIAAWHFLYFPPRAVVYDAHIRPVGDGLVRVESLVGEVPEQARFPRTSLPNEHQLCPSDSLCPADYRLVVCAHYFIHISCQQRHVSTLCVVRMRTAAAADSLAVHQAEE
jgi:hypothetical protein